MTVRVLIKRTIPQEKIPDLMGFFKRLRMLATTQPGYISGETLSLYDRPERYLVISTWQSLEDWNHWFENRERIELQDGIDMLIGTKTDYEIYHYPSQ